MGYSNYPNYCKICQVSHILDIHSVQSDSEFRNKLQHNVLCLEDTECLLVASFASVLLIQTWKKTNKDAGHTAMLTHFDHYYQVEHVEPCETIGQLLDLFGTILNLF